MNRTGQAWRPDVRVWGDRFSGVSFDRLLYLYLHKWGVLGAREHALLERYVRPGMTVVDIGANVGLYTCLLSRLVGETGRVYAFEPEPALFACARRNCDVNGRRNVVLHQAAVGAAGGIATLTRSAVNSGDNRVREGNASGDAVRVVALDDVLGDTRPNFIKMDVQGYERHVLRGMSGTLRNARRLIIYLEFWPFGLRQVGEDPAALLAQLEAESFTLTSDHGGIERPIEDVAAFSRAFRGKAFANVLAIRSE
jgi:FkbM family methyltransferase